MSFFVKDKLMMEANNDTGISSKQESNVKKSKDDALSGPSVVGQSIRVLPQDVVDRIAAGEVVQRPASVVKELIENSLDAKCNCIQVTVDRRTLNLIISDNGTGIAKEDLALAATRFATSKLVTTKDFDSLISFGFRGEALSSTSMVSRLNITSRTRSSPVAFQMDYRDGKPESTSHGAGSTVEPKKCARNLGTTIKVQDIFYNVPLRRKSMLKNTTDEYMRILSVLQSYAIQYASKGVAIICQYNNHNGKRGTSASNSSKSTLVDLNTTPHVLQARSGQGGQNSHHQATERVITAIYGSQLKEHLVWFECELQPTSSVVENGVKSNGKDKNTDNADKIINSENNTNPEKDTCQYKCCGYLTSPSYNSAGTQSMSQSRTINGNLKRRGSNSSFVLFVNDRNVECTILKKYIDDVYKSMTGSKLPFAYLSIHVPPPHVDVNVHPTKQQVALLFLDTIVKHLSLQIEQKLNDHQIKLGHNFCSQGAASVTVSTPSASFNNDNSKNSTEQKISKKRKAEEDDEWDEEEEKVKLTCASSSSTKRQRNNESAGVTKNNATNMSSEQQQEQRQQKRLIAQAKLIRTENLTPVGALEPFLVPTKAKTNYNCSLDPTKDEASAVNENSFSNVRKATTNADGSNLIAVAAADRQIHPNLDCPVGKRQREKQELLLQQSQEGEEDKIDMSQPGAFTKILICTCPKRLEQSNATQRFPFPKRIIPTKCSYTSIKTLRRNVQRRLCKQIQKQLRLATFVGTISNQSSLIQCGQHLVLFNHEYAAQELFYQFALAHFGRLNMTTASFGSNNNNKQANSEQEEESPPLLSTNIDVTTLLEQLLQFEEEISFSQYDNDHEYDSVKEEMKCRKFLQVNETNQHLARQATECLLENSSMLNEYFRIQFEEKEVINDFVINENNTGDGEGNGNIPGGKFNKTKDNDGDGDGDGDSDNKKKQCQQQQIQRKEKRLLLMGLPVLLPGYAPDPSGLPIFLLRLATQVDWSTEQDCFDGICRELAYYYAKLPLSNYSKIVQHIIFPAVVHLLLPPKIVEQPQKNELQQKLKHTRSSNSNNSSDSLTEQSGNENTKLYFTPLTHLTKLYKVFERSC